MDNVINKRSVSERWQDPARKKMIEKSNFYADPAIYQYGFYDGYQLQNDKIDMAIEKIQNARSAIMKNVQGLDNPDQLLQEAICILIKSLP